MVVASRRRRTATGRFILRISPGLHGALRDAARETGVSLNEYCARKLAAPLGALASVADASAVVTRAAALLGDDLIAVAAFGSFVRGEATATSDVDVLIVVEERAELTRELYRRWDASPLLWAGRRVDAHLAHLPAPGTRVAGVWGELAIDGVILFERDLRLSRRLAQVRRDIAAGRILRRTVHGQPYWTGVA